MAIATPLPLLAANDAAFFAIFAVFVVALAVLSFITLRWAIRRDRVGREAWKERQRQRGAPPTGDR